MQLHLNLFETHRFLATKMNISAEEAFQKMFFEDVIGQYKDSDFI
jgi:hypothetical protein